MGVSVSPSISPSVSVSPSLSPSTSPSVSISPSVSPSVSPSISPSMSPSPADLIYPPTQNGLQKTLGAQLDTGEVTTCTLNNTTGIQNKKGLFVVDRVDTGGTEKAAALREYITFDNVSGSTVTGLTRGLGGTTDQDHAVGAVVEFIPDVVQQQALIDTFLVEHGTSGVHATASVITPTGTQTLTNKRITKRITTVTSSATPTPNCDTTDIYTITALAAGATLGAPTGVPTNGQILIVRIKDNASPQTLAFNAIYRFSSDLAAPTTTVTSKTMYLGFIYNSADTKWDNVAQLENF